VKNKNLFLTCYLFSFFLAKIDPTDGNVKNPCKTNKKWEKLNNNQMKYFAVNNEQKSVRKEKMRENRTKNKELSFFI
jgi:hypothetical protein